MRLPVQCGLAEIGVVHRIVQASMTLVNGAQMCLLLLLRVSRSAVLV